MVQAKQAKEDTQLQRGREENRGLARREEFWTPFSFMRRFGEEMDRLFDDFGFGGSLAVPSFGTLGRQAFDWSPQTEIFERDNQLVIRADLPGLTKDDVNVNIEDNRITIWGERRSEHKEENKGGYYRSERSYGSFYRSIPLPEGIDADKTTANFNNGVLEITMPAPAKKAGGKRIEVTEGETAHAGKKNKDVGA
jgi:HSP20 family protein